MNAGARFRNVAAGFGVAIFATITVSPFATKLLAKEPVPVQQQKEEKTTWNISLAGSSMKYAGKKGVETVETGTILLEGRFVEKITGKASSDVGEKDLLAGSRIDNVFVMVGSAGIGAIWVSTSANSDDKTASLALPFDAKSAEIDGATGTITVKGANGEEKKYKVLRGNGKDKNQPQILELREAGKK